MAASDKYKNVRIKVTFEAFQAEDDSKIDSTKKWALIFFSECPTIQDVADKIVASSDCRLTSHEDGGSNLRFTSLELWLDGYLLPSHENSRILRDGDEIKVKTRYIDVIVNSACVDLYTEIGTYARTPVQLRSLL
ncbi:hypothetical protein PoB_005683800 [Plakobranchus ocellatus]|uniref:Uncharacterized protein n=1 Tax=Plakobranchus ocellatus TaxID=259542 RepID=A0AAV4CFQ6_9GAST|nr:hypothetical protein PoB_005683800 [Plakobranchus ocellatus]